MRKVLVASLALAIALLTIGMATHLITLDRYPTLGTYGVSIGTDTHYASAEFVFGHGFTVSYQTAN